MSMLKAKLYQLEMEKKAQEAASLRGEQMEIGWGSQTVLTCSIRIQWSKTIGQITKPAMYKL